MPRLFGAKLRYLRLQHDVMQVDLVRQLGAKRAHINNLHQARIWQMLAADRMQCHKKELHIKYHQQSPESLIPVLGQNQSCLDRLPLTDLIGQRHALDAV